MLNKSFIEKLLLFIVWTTIKRVTEIAHFKFMCCRRTVVIASMKVSAKQKSLRNSEPQKATKT